VFTPRGQIKVLPKGATVVDFAYAIHSDLGNQCVAARVDRRLVPLRTVLRNGRTIDIISNHEAIPNPAWLEFVITGKARAAIRGYLKHLEKDEAEALGRRMLSVELEDGPESLDKLKPKKKKRLLAKLGVESVPELLKEIGLGNRMAKLVAILIRQPNQAKKAKHDAPGRLAIRGTEGMVVKYGKCCRPIPGDPIVATFNPGKGVVVHHEACPNVGQERKRDQSWLEVAWEDQVEGEFSAALRVDLGNKRGLLASIAAAIAKAGSNIDEVRTEEKDGLTSSLYFVVSVSGRRHLATIMRSLRKIPSVLRIYRDLGCN
jgi:guanosine-3',5'-bis(diphosphate) 3'-pyrophosphohydrolase